MGERLVGCSGFLANYNRGLLRQRDGILADDTGLPFARAARAAERNLAVQRGGITRIVAVSQGEQTATPTTTIMRTVD